MARIAPAGPAAKRITFSLVASGKARQLPASRYSLPPPAATPSFAPVIQSAVTAAGTLPRSAQRGFPSATTSACT